MVGCFESSSLLNFPGISHQTYEAKILLEGAHWNSEYEIDFGLVSIGFDYLEEWLGHRPIKTKIDKDENNKNSGFTVKCDFPCKFEFYTNSIRSKLSTSYTAHTIDSSTKSTTLRFSSILESKPDESNSLDWYSKQVIKGVSVDWSRLINRH